MRLRKGMEWTNGIYGNVITHQTTVNWQPLFILFTSKINLTPAQHNILDTYKMQIHLLFECGEDCFTSPVDTRFSCCWSCVACVVSIRLACLTMISSKPILPLHLTHIHTLVFVLIPRLFTSSLTLSLSL